MSEPETLNLFFDRLNEIFRQAAHAAFLATPELRSVVISYDYFGTLNEASEVKKGIWLHHSGQAQKPVDAIAGSFDVMLLNATQILAELVATRDRLVAECTQASKQLMKEKADGSQDA
jgi:hypothetical protein